MRKTAIIWRESIYKNGFRCRCGSVLFANEKLTNSAGIDSDGFVRCLNCNHTAGIMAEIEMKPEEGGMMGNYEGYLKGLMS